MSQYGNMSPQSVREYLPRPTEAERKANLRRRRQRAAGIAILSLLTLVSAVGAVVVPNGWPLVVLTLVFVLGVGVVAEELP